MSEPLLLDTDSTLKDQVRLRSRFVSIHDRWEHRIQLIDKNGDWVLADSCEGGSHQRWPPSPVMQELHQDEVQGQIAVFGVGMAGSSHWSLSASSKHCDSDRQHEIHFDVACLVKEKQADDLWLGSTYRLNESWTVESLSPKQLGFEWNQVRLDIFALGSSDWGTELSIVGDTLKIVPKVLSDSPVKASRWAYRVEFRDNR